MEHHGPVSWLQNLPFLPHEPEFVHVNGAILVFLFILVMSILANRAIKNKIESYVVPPEKGLVSFIDFLLEGLNNLVVGIIGHHGTQHVPFVASLFIFIWLSNLMGLLPLSGTPNSNVNTTYALGILAFLYYNYAGIKAQGLKHYGEHFLMGLGAFGLPIALIELVSHFVRPFSLGVRLRSNMFIDHELAHKLSELFAWIVPVPILLFGVVVCTIQAFLFTVLTSVYIQMATEHE